MADGRPSTPQVMAGLKDFQRATADHAFERLWTAPDAVDRFLVADEVGLGKTMVAKGVIAQTVEHLRDSGKRIDVVYICSNSQIARQNLSRLNVVGGTELRHADRLTLLPKVIRELRGEAINFVSFTPGTSFQVGRSTGAAPERVLLYWMLDRCWQGRVRARPRWAKFFEGGVRRDRFAAQLNWFDRTSLDEELCTSFGAAIEQSAGPGDGPLREELEACAAEFNYLRGDPQPATHWRRNALIGVLRGLVARVAVEHLEPDLVILDEFQRFKDLLDADDEGARLANSIFSHRDAKVLLLSATPYKMYTLPDEPEGDDHYRDFIRTVRFLAQDDGRAHLIEQELRGMRESLLSGDADRGRAARDTVQRELRRLMSRTERLSATPDRDGMLQERPSPGLELAADDLRAWRTFDDIARHIDRHDVFEYWRSTPYPLNLMEQHSYQVRTKFQAAVEREDPEVRRLVATGRGLLDWEDVRSYRKVDPGNAKLRALFCDVLDRGAWRLVWLPPSLPYYETSGAYAEPQLQEFTKRLIFSAWSVVPKAVASLMSYEAERRSFEASGRTDRAYDGTLISPPLQLRMTQDRPASMPNLALHYPSSTLAALGDPLEIARQIGGTPPLPQQQVLDLVRERVTEALAQLPTGLAELPTALAGTAEDQRWYWAAPFLLDRAADPDGDVTAVMSRTESAAGDDGGSALSEHLRLARSITAGELGAQPADLIDVLTLLALAGPGVCALRALSRVSGGPLALGDLHIRRASATIAWGLRSMFNKQEIVATLRAGDDDAYWRQVLEHSLSGCLQAVLDEYVHVLLESEGLQQADPLNRATTISERISEALSVRSATNSVDQVGVRDGRLVFDADPHHIRSHFAARYGRAQTADSAADREQVVRTAYNSPFRPFVLASTSVGQEGLDFHTYSHAVVHWNLPGNPVDLEQREGRVHRYKGHAVRKNVAADFGRAAMGDADDPWQAVFAAAREHVSEDSEIKPFWVYTRDGGAVIERYVPAMPLSKESQRYRRLLRTVGAYRAVIGQPRQDDLIRYVGSDVAWLQIDLTPPSSGPRDGLDGSVPRLG